MEDSDDEEEEETLLPSPNSPQFYFRFRLLTVPFSFFLHLSNRSYYHSLSIPSNASATNDHEFKEMCTKFAASEKSTTALLSEVTKYRDSVTGKLLGTALVVIFCHRFWVICRECIFSCVCSQSCLEVFWTNEAERGEHLSTDTLFFFTFVCFCGSTSLPPSHSSSPNQKKKNSVAEPPGRVWNCSGRDL